MPGTRKRTRIVLLALVAALALLLSACGTTNDEYEQQIADLQAELDQANAELEATQGQLEDTQAQLDDQTATLEETQAQLQATNDRLARTRNDLSAVNDELAATEAELLDAQAQLAQVGEVVLQDGTYVGPILGAKTDPRVIVFNASGNFRVAQVATDAQITSGGRERTLQQLGRLLASTDPAQAELANGNYRVVVRNGLVASIRKSPASA